MDDSSSVAPFVKPGAEVVVETSDGEQDVYRLVSPAEASPRRGLISNDSPVARALMGHRVGDQVTIVAPGGSFSVRIVSIR